MLRAQGNFQHQVVRCRSAFWRELQVDLEHPVELHAGAPRETRARKSPRHRLRSRRPARLFETFVHASRQGSASACA